MTWQHIKLECCPYISKVVYTSSAQSNKDSTASFACIDIAGILHCVASYSTHCPLFLLQLQIDHILGMPWPSIHVCAFEYSGLTLSLAISFSIFPISFLYFLVSPSFPFPLFLTDPQSGSVRCSPGRNGWLKYHRTP